MGKTDWFEVWVHAVPSPFCHDRVLGSRIRDLIKFSTMTYRVHNMDRPDIKRHKPCDPQYKRSIHKQIKYFHGV